MEKKLQKSYPTDYSLLIAQDTWQAHYNFWPILFLKEFIKLNLNADMMKKYVWLAELNANIATALLNTNFKGDFKNRVCKGFNIKRLGDVLYNFENICLDIYINLTQLVFLLHQD